MLARFASCFRGSWMTSTGSVLTLEVRKTNIDKTRIFKEPLLLELKENEVLIRINRQALTANNVSYAISGSALGYWDFFSVDEEWGRLPGMGWGDVVASAHPGINVGERIWGFFPFSTHLKVLCGGVGDATFLDVSPHRANNPLIYRSYERASGIPGYERSREDQDCIMRGLFFTSWLVEDFISSNGFFGTRACVITSASSKTSISLARCIRLRGEQSSIGITSPENLEFCRQLDVYDQVVCYDDIESLAAHEPTMLVDMAGNAKVTSALHHRYGDNMKRSIRIGATHQDASEMSGDLPGEKPTFFFAPRHTEARAKEIGYQRLFANLWSALADFRHWCDSWLVIEHHYGADAVESTYHNVRTGAANPAAGKIVSFWNAEHSASHLLPRALEQ